jgi:hypothetical protein
MFAVMASKKNRFHAATSVNGIWVTLAAISRFALANGANHSFHPFHRIEA